MKKKIIVSVIEQRARAKALANAAGHKIRNKFMNKLSLKLIEGCFSYDPLSDNDYSLFALGMFLSNER